MKTSIRIIAAAAICLATQSSFAHFTTLGEPDCGQWLAEKTPTRRAWVLGYVSGLNLSGIEKMNVLGATSAEQIYAWMDNYCRQNPLDDVTHGGNKLFFELLARAKARK